MIDVLQSLADILDEEGLALIFQGVLPHKPDRIIALTPYDGSMQPFFGGVSGMTYRVQARCRDVDAVDTFKLAQRAMLKLDHYHDGTISVLAIAPPMDIGWDDANPPRREFTINFEVSIK